MTAKLDLSEDARTALINAGTNRQGAKVMATWPVHKELVAAGLIGDGGGLTRAGTIERERLVTEALDDLF